MQSEGDTVEADLVVLGSGVSGLTAALTAALAGLRVVVLEHLDVIGGTSARSSGTVWIPDNHYARARGLDGDGAAAEAYLDALLADRGAPEMWRAFLEAGPRMLRDLETRAGLGFRPFMTAADYRQDCPGAAPGGRALEPLAFDGRLLGKDFSRLGRPLPELMLFGGMMVTRAEAAELLQADRSPRAAMLVARLVARYLRDRLRYGRGTRLVLGNALVARLLKTCLNAGVEIRVNVATERLVLEKGWVVGVAARAHGRRLAFRVARGVVMAGGGFPANAGWRVRELPAPVAEHTPASPGADGSTMALALEAGAALGSSGLDNALWFPSSIAKRPDGTTAVYPHIVLDRPKPGLVAVDASGRRFVNEAVSYHEFVRGMYRANAVPAWLVCDREFIRKYGLGLIRPRTPSLRKHVESGYLTEAGSIAELADRIGVPAADLETTIARFNGFAATGRDEDFHRGETIYDRGNGDAAHRPNPSLGPIERAPFYAVAVWPTPLGTSRGLVADAQARVLDGEGRPIPGLFVCGNDMHSVFGGEYPGAGAQLGQGMTFGWIAARTAAGIDEA
ncbi:FAD-dependent oxidoreductase [Lutibaculum baratangense]|uniref:Succinate dehydrogenase/fumarate reductase, flavoprotein subunit n=1 Tax=Lutibaculum baratangense AMV1 TaxID=631454 RepID=V4TM77_9HYPH|nr:FAD-dependent oxidoreductase [Lutibaculum baratangense]ESR26863.1 succinate dehydrogenase/fumarate reductase, flavoprotein subunit [Lutibaculum baratangense AMV1]